MPYVSIPLRKGTHVGESENQDIMIETSVRKHGRAQVDIVVGIRKVWGVEIKLEELEIEKNGGLLKFSTESLGMDEIAMCSQNFRTIKLVSYR